MSASSPVACVEEMMVSATWRSYRSGHQRGSRGQPPPSFEPGAGSTTVSSSPNGPDARGVTVREGAGAGGAGGAAAGGGVVGGRVTGPGVRSGGPDGTSVVGSTGGTCSAALDGDGPHGATGVVVARRGIGPDAADATIAAGPG